MSTAIAKNLMAEMKLLGMLSAFDKVLHEATRDKPSYSELLDALLQAEADYRQERKTGYRIKAAKFTLRPAFEDIDLTAARSISKTQIKELYSLQWLRDARPLLLIGQTGVGKTFIAQAAGLHACLRQIRAVHDAHDLARESGAGPQQRRLPALPRQARQTGSRHTGRHGDA